MGGVHPLNELRTVLSRLVAVALVTGVTLGAGCTQSPEVRKQKALERAEVHLKDGKPNEAIIELRNTLQVDKDFVPALHALGRAYTAKLWYADAIRELKRAQTLAPDSVPIALDLGRASVDFGAWKEAGEQADKVLGREPGNRAGLEMPAAALLGQGKAAEALVVLDTIPAAQRGASQSVRGRALARLGKTAEAEQAFKAALAADPKDYRSLSGLGEISLSRRQWEEAAKLYGDAKAIQPGDPRIRLGLATAKAQLKKVPEAIQELESLDRRSRTFPVILALGTLYLQANRPTEAINLLPPVVQRLPQATDVRFLLASAYLANNQADYAIGEFETLVRENPKNTLVQYRLAQAFLRRGQAKEALARLDGIAKSFEKVAEYHLERGRAFMVLGRPDDAVKAVAVAQKLAPDWPQPYLLAGEIRLQQGDRSGAREMYVKAAELDASYAPAHMALGRLNEAEQKFDAALQEFDAAVAADPKSVATVRSKAGALVRQKKVKEAIQFVEAKVKEEPNNEALRTLLGAVYLVDKQYDKSGAAYKAAVDLDQRAVAPRLGFARVALAQQRKEEALTQLQSAVKIRPDHRVGLLLASLADKLGRAEVAVPALEAALKASPKQTDLVMVLSELYVRVGKYDQAIAGLSTLIAENPNLTAARIVRGQALLAKRDGAAALKDFTAVAQAHPKSAQAHYLLARSHVVLNQVNQAKKEYEEALKLDPKLENAKTELAVLSGAKLDQDVYTKRVAQLREAIKKDPRNVALRMALATDLITLRQTKEAQTELKQLLELSPSHPVANVTMAELLLAQGSADEGANYLRAALRGNPSHIRANVLLGRYLESRGEREEAIARYQAALRVNPNLWT